MKKQLTVLALAAAAATSAFAEPQTFAIDNSHTFPRFSYSHFGLSTQLSHFDKTTGNIVLDKAAKTGSVDITIDTKSVNTGFATFNEHIQGEDFLDTAKYPTATFKSTKVIFEGDRLEPNFSDTPGQWGFVYLRQGSKNHSFNHFTLKNATKYIPRHLIIEYNMKVLNDIYKNYFQIFLLQQSLPFL